MDWEKETFFEGLSVSVYNSDKELVFSGLSNSAGLVYLELEAGFYNVSVQSGNRTVGFQEINVDKSDLFTIGTWSYDLNVTCIDADGKRLPNHIVFLHDQMVFYDAENFTALTNQTGPLVNWVETDENGTAYFHNVWNGTYMIRVFSSELVGMKELNISRSKSITVKCNKTYLAIRFVTQSEPNEPLSNATVYIQNSKGHLVLKKHTDQNGYIYHESVYADNYTVFVEWMGTEVYSGVLSIEKGENLTISCSVGRLTLRITDPFGNPLPHASIILRRIIGQRRRVGSEIKLETDEQGLVSSLLPSGSYLVSCSYSIYSSSAKVNLAGNYMGTIRSDVRLNVWFLTFLVSSPLIGLTILLERKRLRKPLEIKKYKNMLSKLESMYRNGLVEYRLYRKLREEYETKLMELGGREGR